MYRKRKTNNNVNIEALIFKRYNILIFIILGLFLILVFKLFGMQIVRGDEYNKLILENSTNIVYGASSPRGRILDRNYNVIVDNVAVKKIFYKKEKGIKSSEEISIAYQLSKILELDYSKLTTNSLKDFWIVNNSTKANKLITEEEINKLRMRKLNNKDIYNLKIKRITEDDLKDYTELDKKTAYIYFLMNKGYSYENKIIKNEDVTEKEFATINENADDLIGVTASLDWERIYPYGDTFKSILGRVSNSSGIPAELKDYYLEKGYSLNDRVGVSYLEYQYEDILKGTKEKYKILPDNTYKKIKDGKRGQDIVLSIDINLQKEIENILSEEVLNTKKEPNTDFYDKSMVVITDPASGEVLAMSGKQVIEKDGKNEIIDYTPGVLTSPVIVGSVIKGASILTGYSTGAIDIGTKFDDSCIKIKDTKEKCSSTKGMGIIDDIKAIVMSSNVYQFRTAMKVAHANYSYNAPLKIDTKAFEIYRNMYSSFGLGIKTGIDLPVESTGYKGTSKLGGHLLDFSIGQYDTYTPIQLSQYISTIANGGTRYQMDLLKEVHKSTRTDELGALAQEHKPTILNTIDVEQKYFDRVRLAFNSVMKGPLGNGYMGEVENPAGKTGTSESFYDSDNDGKIDKETTTKTFVGYAPADNPKMSIAVVSPNVSHSYNKSKYTTNVNKRIASRISNKFFEIFK